MVQNALFLGRKRMSALTIPWCTYTDPEVARVGLYVKQARERKIPVKTFTVQVHLDLPHFHGRVGIRFSSYGVMQVQAYPRRSTSTAWH